jgi:hypothetical protein
LCAGFYQPPAPDHTDDHDYDYHDHNDDRDHATAA